MCSLRFYKREGGNEFFRLYWCLLLAAPGRTSWTPERASLFFFFIADAVLTRARNVCELTNMRARFLCRIIRSWKLAGTEDVGFFFGIELEGGVLRIGCFWEGEKEVDWKRSIDFLLRISKDAAIKSACFMLIFEKNSKDPRTSEPLFSSLSRLFGIQRQFRSKLCEWKSRTWTWNFVRRMLNSSRARVCVYINRRECLWKNSLLLLRKNLTCRTVSHWVKQHQKEKYIYILAHREKAILAPAHADESRLRRRSRTAEEKPPWLGNIRA